MTRPDRAFWRGRRVLLTGHTGFKGAWLALWLRRLGAEVTGLALEPLPRSLFAAARIEGLLASRIADVRDAQAVAAIVREARPEVVFHLAAQALVRAGYRDPPATHATNVMGTAHLLDALRASADVRVAVVVTTDKVYRDATWPYPYRENDALGGHDPYSASKAAAELITASYRDAFLAAQGVALATARAGNVIGGGDWSEDRLVPDAVRAWEAGDVLRLRRPQAVRPWQHVLDPLAGYLRLAESLWQQPELAGAYNFGPRTDEAASVAEVVALARAAYGRGEWQADDATGPHETHWLALEVEKSRQTLGVAARWSLAEAVGRTMRWYRRLADGADARALCEADLEDHEAAP
ncbi:MAG TPA: CDP-glucose 4,6-dehydratase [Ideonella sp.]|nr:CDP-glucose 4,6-dehydratase [Ideonella sp.]